MASSECVRVVILNAAGIQNWNGHTAIGPVEGRSAVAQLTRGQVQEHMDGGHFGADFVLF